MKYTIAITYGCETSEEVDIPDGLTSQEILETVNKAVDHFVPSYAEDVDWEWEGIPPKGIDEMLIPPDGSN